MYLTCLYLFGDTTGRLLSIARVPKGRGWGEVTTAALRGPLFVWLLATAVEGAVVRAGPAGSLKGNIETTCRNLRDRSFTVSVFETSSCTLSDA